MTNMETALLRVVDRIEVCVTILWVLLMFAIAGLLLQMATAYRVAEVQGAVQGLDSAAMVAPAQAGGE